MDEIHFMLISRKQYLDIARAMFVLIGRIIRKSKNTHYKVIRFTVIVYLYFREVLIDPWVNQIRQGLR